jgi:hypothetical protein
LPSLNDWKVDLPPGTGANPEQLVRAALASKPLEQGSYRQPMEDDVIMSQYNKGRAVLFGLGGVLMAVPTLLAVEYLHDASMLGRAGFKQQFGLPNPGLDPPFWVALGIIAAAVGIGAYARSLSWFVLMVITTIAFLQVQPSLVKSNPTLWETFMSTTWVARQSAGMGNPL